MLCVSTVGTEVLVGTVEDGVVVTPIPGRYLGGSWWFGDAPCDGMCYVLIFLEVLMGNPV